MDGFGIREESCGNAIKAAKTPNLTKFFTENPFTTIGASGLDVGLPDGQMGNSEVGSSRPVSRRSRRNKRHGELQK